mmetsp:Transcript_18871/g.51284  ORF Transcript_18871/g.51284 Transcript_18871/m.51284 type:complete len:212 (+) Transcript_18871:32-667(+)
MLVALAMPAASLIRAGRADDSAKNLGLLVYLLGQVPRLQLVGPAEAAVAVIDAHAHQEFPQLLRLPYPVAARLALIAREGPRPALLQQQDCDIARHRHDPVFVAGEEPALHLREVRAPAVVLEVRPGDDHRTVPLGEGLLLLDDQVEAALPVHELVHGPHEGLGSLLPEAVHPALALVLDVGVDILVRHLSRIRHRHELHGMHWRQSCLDS